MVYKVDADGATVDGLFTDGNPSLGIVATALEEDWHNMVQTELVNVVEDSGQTLNKLDNTQLLQAINIKIGQAQATVQNLKLKYSSATLKIVGEDDADLSSTNVGYLKMNFGQTVKKFTITSSPSFVDGASGNMVDQEFGITKTRDWGYDRLQYIYATYNSSDTLYFFTSPDPTKTTTPTTAAEIGYHSNPSTNNADTDIFVWTATNVTVTLQSRPCVLLGSYRHTWNGTTYYWNVTTLGNSDGIGRFNVGTRLRTPLGQMGAASGKHFKDNGGTAATYTGASELYYCMDPSGWALGIFHFTNSVGGTAGSGAVAVQLSTPYKNLGMDAPARGTATIANGASIGTTAACSLSNGLDYITFSYQTTIVTTLTTLTNANQNDVSRQISGQIYWKAF